MAKKILEGRALVAGEFSFELLENGKVASTGTNDADGNVVFSDIEFTEAARTSTQCARSARALRLPASPMTRRRIRVTADVVEIDND